MTTSILPAIALGSGGVYFPRARFLLPAFPLLLPVALQLSRASRRCRAPALTVAVAVAVADSAYGRAYVHGAGVVQSALKCGKPGRFTASWAVARFPAACIRPVRRMLDGQCGCAPCPPSEASAPPGVPRPLHPRSGMPRTGRARDQIRVR